jgi:hypothetical protein
MFLVIFSIQYFVIVHYCRILLLRITIVEIPTPPKPKHKLTKKYIPIPSDNQPLDFMGDVRCVLTVNTGKRDASDNWMKPVAVENRMCISREYIDKIIKIFYCECFSQ